MNAEANLKALNLVLPDAAAPSANYVRFKTVGDLIFLSGQGPRHPDGSMPAGIVGKDFSVEEAYGFARTTGLGLLAAMKEACGSLDKVEVIKVLGMVNAAPGFTQHPQVINGCSDLFVAVLGENGRHARSAVGMGSLPGNMPVEIECIVRTLP
jgi:enamine deaminase RidA (YjgF/YER057c/UK114 family)